MSHSNKGRAGALSLLAALSLATVMGCASGATTDRDGEGGDAGGSAGAAGAGGSKTGPVQTTGGMGGGVIIGQGGGAGGEKQGCTADVMTDPANCGECGNKCELPGAYPACKAGKCVIDKCADDFQDLNGDPADGCEYGCTKSAGGKEICDNKDNDCNGKVDDGFDLKKDVKNCGSCGNECFALNADSTCEDGKCAYKCKEGFSDLDAKSAGGCIYKCPVSPPVAEVCNGIDDDCDGAVDNGMPGDNQPCEENCPGGKCQGECKPGTTLCTGTSDGIICVGGVGPAPEYCDDLDNDCDGVVDNGFDLENDPLNCGGCGVQCQAGDACLKGKCQFSCKDGFVDLDKDPSNGCEYQCPVFPPKSGEVCDGVDDDCNGAIDDNATDVNVACTGNCPAPDPCVATGNCGAYQIAPSVGACFGACTEGLTACAAGGTICLHPTFKQDEECNGVDDNCDGRVDEGYDLKSDPFNCGKCGNHCTAPDAAIVACVNGACGTVTVCSGGFADIDGNPANGCEYKCPTYPPAVETCNGVDDDCDGVADNNVTDVGVGCNDNCPAPDPCVATGSCAPYAISPKVGSCHGACTSNGKTICKDGAPFCEHGGFASTEACNGLDDNCDGRIDEGFDLQSDPNNCGACGKVCDLFGASAATCVAGKCVPSACDPGYADVDKNAANGCEYKCPVNPPKAETCNGLDDDCDGLIDDSVTDAGQPCDSTCPAKAPCVAQGTCSYPLSACVGACCGSCTQGKTTCINGQQICQAGTGPALEVCNGKDDNCDGQIDEGFDLQNDPLNCGACGNKCNLPGAYSTCVAGKCEVKSCKFGFNDLDKLDSNGCEYTCPVNPPTAEACNGKDDDCNGVVDDGVATPPNFCNQNGPCAGSKPVCGGSKGFICNYGPAVEVDANGQLLLSETLCDGLDGNCDGKADESFPNVGKPCGAGSGACAQTSTFTCAADKKSVVCNAVADNTKAVDETCNGVDDDCDGVVDGTVASPGTCFNGGAHTCKRLADPMVQVGAVWIYAYEASHPDATANVVGNNSSRACSKPGVLPWASVSETQAAAACAAIKDSKGAPMRLCTTTEWATACNLGVTGNVWSYASSATTYNTLTCNGYDTTIDTVWPTGSGAQCYANQPNGKVYDLSGNVAEWTSTSFTSSGKTYFKIRGGAYDSFSTGTSCNFDFEAQTAGFSHATVGFRCCADNAP